jgi:hypothetical protein
MSKRAVAVVVVVVGLCIAGLAVGHYYLFGRGSWEGPPPDQRPMRTLEDTAPPKPLLDDFVPKGTSGRVGSPAHYGLTREEYLRQRLATLPLGQMPRGEAFQNYPGFAFATLDRAVAPAATETMPAVKEIYALLREQKVLTEANPVIFLENADLPVPDPARLRTRVLVPIRDASEVQPPLVKGRLPDLIGIRLFGQKYNLDTGKAMAAMAPFAPQGITFRRLLIRIAENAVDLDPEQRDGPQVEILAAMD